MKISIKSAKSFSITKGDETVVFTDVGNIVIEFDSQSQPETGVATDDADSEVDVMFTKEKEEKTLEDHISDHRLDDKQPTIVHIRNFPEDTSQSDVERLCLESGLPLSVKMDRCSTLKCPAFFVKYRLKETAANAVKKLDRKWFRGHELRARVRS